MTATGPALRRFMRSWPGGVAVVTSAADGAPAGCTVNSFISVSLRPPLLLVSLARDSRTLAAIVTSGAFAVNVLTADQRDLADLFATAAANRFAGLPYHWQDDIPLLDGVSASAICQVERTIDAADHTLVLGRPETCAAMPDTTPLIFVAGTYCAVPH